MEGRERGIRFYELLFLEIGLGEFLYLICMRPSVKIGYVIEV